MSKRRNGSPVQFSLSDFRACVIELGWEFHAPAENHWQARRGKQIFNLWPTTGKCQKPDGTIDRVRTIDDLEMRLPTHVTNVARQSESKQLDVDERIAVALERIAAALESQRQPLFD